MFHALLSDLKADVSLDIARRSDILHFHLTESCSPSAETTCSLPLYILSILRTRILIDRVASKLIHMSRSPYFPARQ